MQVMAQIAGDGERPLPWEDIEQSDELLQQLGALKRDTLALLARNPVDRSSIQEFVHACERILDSTRPPPAGGD